MPIASGSEAEKMIRDEIRITMDAVRGEPVNDVNMTNSVINRLAIRVVDIVNENCSRCNRDLWDRIGLLEEDASNLLSAVRDLIDDEDPR